MISYGTNHIFERSTNSRVAVKVCLWNGDQFEFLGVGLAFDLGTNGISYFDSPCMVNGDYIDLKIEVVPVWQRK